VSWQYFQRFCIIEYCRLIITLFPSFISFSMINIGLFFFLNVIVVITSIIIQWGIFWTLQVIIIWWIQWTIGY
jgi:hypothetical protein